MFGSWGSEEFGLLGSTEWTEDNVQLLTERAVSYINVDIAVFANQSFYARASPLLKQVLYDSSQKVSGIKIFRTKLFFHIELHTPRAVSFQSQTSSEDSLF